MNLYANPQTQKWRKQGNNFTSLFGVMFLAACISLPMIVSAKQFSQLVSNFIKLTLSINYSWSTDDPFKTNLPSAEYAYPSMPAGVLTNDTGGGQDQEEIILEMKVTAAPTGSHADTNKIEIHEDSSYTVVANHKVGAPSTLSTGSGPFDIKLPQNIATSVGTAADPIFYAVDAPGIGRVPTQNAANDTNVISVVATISNTDGPKYEDTNSVFQVAGTSKSETYAFTCSYFTNTVGTIPTSTTTNAWNGSPHWYGSHSP